MPRPIAHPVLYLDYDGVLHPDEVYRVCGRIILWYDGIALFEWWPLLAECLEPYPSIRVVLSTSWVRVLSFDEARERLPQELARRVIGATWHSAMNQHWWVGLSRYQQIQFHAKLHRVERWLTIDYDNERWPQEHVHRLVRSDSILGIAAPDSHSLSLMRTQLRELAAGLES